LNKDHTGFWQKTKNAAFSAALRAYCGQIKVFIKDVFFLGIQDLS